MLLINFRKNFLVLFIKNYIINWLEKQKELNDIRMENHKLDEKVKE